MNQRYGINYIHQHNRMGYRKNAEDIDDSCTLKQYCRCHIAQIENGQVYSSFTIFAFTDIIQNKVKRYRKQEKSKVVYKIKCSWIWN